MIHNIDIVILSNAKNEKLQTVTKQTIESLFKSEKESKINFKVFVIESNRSLTPYEYKNTKTIYPEEEFGFHKYLNIGLKAGTSELICFCNNDLLFHTGWATEHLAVLKSEPDLACLNSFCPIFHGNHKNEFVQLNRGYNNGTHFTGWCFLTKRSNFSITGPFDESLVFWYCDDDYRLTLQKHGLKNVMVKSSKVTHIGSQTLSTEKISTANALMLHGYAYFKYKWVHHNYFFYLIDIIRYKSKVFFFNLRKKQLT